MSEDATNYIYIVAGLSSLTCVITYCATNWDDPPEWWPNALQPWWNKQDPVETEDKDKLEEEKTDQEVEKEQLVQQEETINVVQATAPVVSKENESMIVDTGGIRVVIK